MTQSKLGIRNMMLISILLSVLLSTIILILSYSKMVIPRESIGILILITIVANVSCIIMILLMVRPIIRAIEQVCKESKQIASGHFSVKINTGGPRELHELATHFNEMSSNVDAMFREVQEQEKRRQELIANLSHDLKTPIASIRSYSDALIDGVVEGDAAKQYLKTISTESVELTHLIDELMLLSDVDTKQNGQIEQSYFVDQMVVELLESFRLDLERKQIEVHLMIDPDIPNERIVPEKIRRVLMNLLKNALDFSPDHGELWCRIQSEGKYLRFSIKDTGIGISASQQELIFERFYRVEKSRNRKYGGHGLGLAICKGIVTLYGGEIGVISAPRKGSEFWFTLPIK